VVTRALGQLIFGSMGRMLARMPRCLGLALGSVLGKFLRRLGWKRACIRSNLLLAFPGSEAPVEAFRAQVERDFYDHFGKLLFEFLAQFGDWRRWVLNQVSIQGLEHWQRAHAQGKGVVFITSHLGNWEAMAARFAVSESPQSPGRELLIVTKHLKPEWLHQEFERNRAKAGVSGTYEPKTMKDVLRALSKGKTVGFVLDQYAGAPIGVRVPFFGIPVGTLLAPAAIVKRTGAIPLHAVCFREKSGRLLVKIEALEPWISAENSHQELALNTARWVEAIERAIRERPAQWLWSHRRFKGDLSPLNPTEWAAPRERA
jgi:KDO2-lipid IV(A) lauroyltransferase